VKGKGQRERGYLLGIGPSTGGKKKSPPKGWRPITLGGGGKFDKKRKEKTSHWDLKISQER